MTEKFSALERRFQALESTSSSLPPAERKNPRDEPPVSPQDPEEAQSSGHTSTDDAGEDLSSSPPSAESPGPTDTAADRPQPARPQTSETTPPATAEDSPASQPGSPSANQPNRAATSHGSASPPANTLQDNQNDQPGA
jgi:hypothetical protein